MCEEGLQFDVVYIFVFKCVIYILQGVLVELEQDWLLVIKFWCFNECYYGGLQGLDKVEIVVKYGEEQVKVWCCLYDILLLLMDLEDLGYLIYDCCYVGLDCNVLLGIELLVIILDCVLLYWYDVIVLQLKDGKIVLVIVYGNLLCVLYKYFNNVLCEEIFELNILIGILLLFELNDDLIVQLFCYLGDLEVVCKVVEVVVNQGKVK